MNNQNRLSVDARLIMETIGREYNDAIVADVVGGTMLEPRKYVYEMERLKQAGILEIDPEVLAELRKFVNCDPALSVTTDEDSRANLLFSFVNRPSWRDKKYRVALKQEHYVAH